MEESVRNRLDSKLKRMVEQLDQVKKRKEQPKSQCGSGNIIRRRRGQEDKRFSA